MAETKQAAPETLEEGRRWPFLGWMSIVEMQQHVRELRAEIERLEARLKRKSKARAIRKGE